MSLTPKPVLLTTRHYGPSLELHPHPHSWMGAGWPWADSQAGAGVPSPSDAAAGEGRLPGGGVGGLPEAAACLPLHRRPTVRQAKEDIGGVSVQDGGLECS